MVVSREKFRALCTAFADIEDLPANSFRWYAFNKNGAIYAYNHKPDSYIKSDQYDIYDARIFIGCIDSNIDNWRDLCVEIPPKEVKWETPIVCDKSEAIDVLFNSIPKIVFDYITVKKVEVIVDESFWNPFIGNNRRCTYKLRLTVTSKARDDEYHVYVHDDSTMYFNLQTCDMQWK